MFDNCCTLICHGSNVVQISFIKIDLGRVRVVSGVATQGYSFNLWTTQYHLNYSIDGTVWKRYMESGIVKVIILLSLQDF